MEERISPTATNDPMVIFALKVLGAGTEQGLALPVLVQRFQECAPALSRAAIDAAVASLLKEKGETGTPDLEKLSWRQLLDAKAEVAAQFERRLMASVMSAAELLQATGQARPA